MSAFTVTVRTLDQVLSFHALGTDSCSVHMDAVDRFGVCAITVKPR